jgi:hypothetical protein
VTSSVTANRVTFAAVVGHRSATEIDKYDAESQTLDIDVITSRLCTPLLKLYAHSDDL